MHCIAHREALAVVDATRAFLEFQMLDRFSNKVYKWVGHSTNQRDELKQSSKDVFVEDYVVVLHIHAVRWLSRGNVMTQLL